MWKWIFVRPVGKGSRAGWKQGKQQLGPCFDIAPREHCYPSLLDPALLLYLTKMMGCILHSLEPATFVAESESLGEIPLQERIVSIFCSNSKEDLNNFKKLCKSRGWLVACLKNDPLLPSSRNFRIEHARSNLKLNNGSRGSALTLMSFKLW